MHKLNKSGKTFADFFCYIRNSFEASLNLRNGAKNKLKVAKPLLISSANFPTHPPTILKQVVI